MSRLLLLLPLTLLLAPPADAQTGPRPQHLSATWLRDSIASASRAPGGSPGTLMSDQGAYRFFGVRRDRSGEAEVHGGLDDVFMVQEGVGTLVLGGRIQGERETTPGELRGGEIVGGRTSLLASGDVVVIPAGVPHQVQVAPGGSITYVVMKIPRAQAVAR